MVKRKAILVAAIQSLPHCDDYGADDNDDAGDNKEEGTEAGCMMMMVVMMMVTDDTFLCCKYIYLVLLFIAKSTYQVISGTFVLCCTICSVPASTLPGTICTVREQNFSHYRNFEVKKNDFFNSPKYIFSNFVTCLYLVCYDNVKHTVWKIP